MHAIEEAKGCMQKGKDFNRLQAKFFWRNPFSRETPSLGEKSFLGRTHFWGEAILGRSHFRGEAIFWAEAIFGEKPFWGEAIKKIPCPRDPPFLCSNGFHFNLRTS